MTIINRQPGTEARVEMWVKIILECDSHMNYMPRFVVAWSTYENLSLDVIKSSVPHNSCDVMMMGDLGTADSTKCDIFTLCPVSLKQCVDFK